MIEIANFFSSVKIALAVLKLMYIETYQIYFNYLSHGHSVKYKKKIKKNG